MEFRPADKLILIMLTEIYKKLGIDGEIEPDFVQKVIFDDHLWALGWKYSGLFPESKSPPYVSEVVNHLDMWDCIEISVEALSEPDKKALDTAMHPFGSATKFRGYDGNNETSYMSAARFMVEDLDRFQRFKGLDFNSHMPCIDMYRRMHPVFDRYRVHMGSRRLNVAELTEILSEMVHPSNR